MQNRNTKQRIIVLDTVRELANHPTAERVFSHIQNKYPQIAKGTVYRNLNILSNNGEIAKIEMPNAPTRFDHQLHSHFHLRCKVCGKVIDSKSDENKTTLLQFSESGFEVESFNLILNGTCAECKNIKKKEIIL